MKTKEVHIRITVDVIMEVRIRDIGAAGVSEGVLPCVTVWFFKGMGYWWQTCILLVGTLNI